jgi:hypothetical protein
MPTKLGRVLGMKGQAEVVTIFAMVANTDTMEGRGNNIDHSYHATEAGALEAGRGKGQVGGDAEAEPRLAVRFPAGEYLLLAEPRTFPTEDAPLITVNVMTEAQEDEIRRRAIAKLSVAEKAVLGIKD